jgi:hypothetical protein
VHTHSFLEIAVVTGGEGVHVSLAGRQPLHVGDVILLRPGVWHGYEECRHLDLYNCCFSTELLRRELAWTREDLVKHNRGSSIERFFDKGLTVLPALDAIAAETGASHGAIALAWLMRQPGIAAPIASASKPEQLDIQFEALTLELSDDQLDRLTAAGT